MPNSRHFKMFISDSIGKIGKRTLTDLGCTATTKFSAYDLFQSKDGETGEMCHTSQLDLYSCCYTTIEASLCYRTCADPTVEVTDICLLMCTSGQMDYNGAYASSINFEQWEGDVRMKSRSLTYFSANWSIQTNW